MIDSKNALEIQLKEIDSKFYLLNQTIGTENDQITSHEDQKDKIQAEI